MAAELGASTLAPIGREFFKRDTVTVARELLGSWLVRSGADGLSGGPIVEVEAYGGPEDRASHTRAGRTKRTEPMFGQVGHAYVYLVYGMHNCLNVVAYDASGSAAGAVLIRAIEPRLGLDQGNPLLCAGPALVCRTLAITRADSGTDLTSGDRLWLAAGATVEDGQVATGPRVGVAYAGPGWADRPWRFWIRGNPAVSRHR